MKTELSLDEEILVAIKKAAPRGFLTQNEHRVFEKTYGKERMLIAIKGLIEDGFVNRCLMEFGGRLTVVADKMTLTKSGETVAKQLIADSEG